MAPVNYNKTYLEVEVVMKFFVFSLATFYVNAKKYR